MNEKHDYIAVFDSGVGGISVLRHLRKALPGERFLYFGDSANAPYGSRPTEEVRALTLAAVRYLLSEYPLKALVIACNTATAAAVTSSTVFPHWESRFSAMTIKVWLWVRPVF